MDGGKQLSYIEQKKLSNKVRKTRGSAFCNDPFFTQNLPILTKLSRVNIGQIVSVL
jgi:hypothetical protein